MNYAEQLKNTYYAHKKMIEENRKKLGLSYVMTLEDKLKDGYKAYKDFCRATGSKPKKFIDFLKTEVI